MKGVKGRKKRENLPSCSHVFEETQNLVISHCFAEDCKEMYQNVKCTCKVNVFLVAPVVCDGTLIAIGILVA